MSYMGEGDLQAPKNHTRGSDAMGLCEREFDLCYRKQYPAIFAFCLSRGLCRADAEESASETFVRLWNRADEMDGRDELEIKKWLYVTAGNVVKEYRRRAMRTQTVPLEELEGVLPDGDSDSAHAIEQEQYRHYLARLERELNESEWELFRLAFLEQMPYERVVRELNLRPDALRARIMRLRKKLRSILPQLFANSFDTKEEPS